MLQLLMLSGACRPSFPIIWNKSLHGFGSFGEFGIGRRALTGRARLQRVQTPPRWQQPSHTTGDARPSFKRDRARQLRQCGTLNHFEKEQAMDSFPGSGKAIFLLLRSPAHVDGRVAGKEYKSLWPESTDMKLKSGALQRTLLADVSIPGQTVIFLAGCKLFGSRQRKSGHSCKCWIQSFPPRCVELSWKALSDP